MRRPVNAMDYTTEILVENHNEGRLRAFRDESSARRYIEKLATRLLRLYRAGKTSMFVTSADIHLVRKSGALRLVATFEDYGPGDGCWRE